MGPREPDAGFEPPLPRSDGEGPLKPGLTVGLPGEGRGRFRSRRVRLFLALGGGILALLCLGGVGVFVVLYDEATEIKRTAPDAVVNSYLGALLSHRDDQEALLYQCDSGGNFAQLVEFRADTQRREKDFSVGISMSWSIVALTINGSSAAVDADLTRTIANQAGRDSTSWRFTVVDQNGWRVCGAAEL